MILETYYTWRINCVYESMRKYLKIYVFIVSYIKNIDENSYFQDNKIEYELIFLNSTFQI